MSRKRHHEDHTNHEAWAIPYADLMTLLLAFFVVMYAISSVNEGKYRSMADSLSVAFGGKPRPVQTLPPGPTTGNQNPLDRPSVIPSPLPTAPQTSTDEHKPTREDAQERVQRQLSRINHHLERALAPLLRKGLITIWRNERWIEVEINSDILFATGSAVLDEDARTILELLATVLRDEPNKVRVEGHTDNVPIATALYPSNWELSAARAASVVHLFADHGLQPQRMAMLGYGEFRPRADNALSEGRNRNRRVAVVVLADDNNATDDREEGIENAALPKTVLPKTVEVDSEGDSL